MLPPSVIKGAAARARATREYALTSCATRNASRLVSRKLPSRASRGANATECNMRCSLPNRCWTSANTREISSSFVTSHGRIGVSWPKVPTNSSTFSFSRSPWYVKTSFAPWLCHACAIAHAIERLFATPNTTPSFLANNEVMQPAVRKLGRAGKADRHEDKRTIREFPTGFGVRQSSAASDLEPRSQETHGPGKDGNTS